MPAYRVPVLFAFVFFASACSGAKGILPPPFQKIDDNTIRANDMTHLKTAKVEKKTFPITVDLPGRVTIPDKNIFVLTARVQGRIEAITPSVGDAVSVGQILATVWSPDLVNVVEEMQIAKEQNSLSLEQLTKQKLTAMGLAADDAREGLSSFPIRSRISGVVIERKLNAGAAIQPGDTIMTIGKLDSYQFQGELAPEQAMKLRQGMKVIFEEDLNLQATIRSVSPVPDPISRLVKIRCSFDQKPPSLPQETLLKGKVVVRETPALVASSKAMVLTGEGEFIFVRVKGDNPLFRKIKVNIGSRTKREIAIDQDGQISDDSEVVSDGALLLNDVLDGGA